MSRKHLTYSASGTDRWLACPGSAKVASVLPERKDAPRYTVDGTLTHNAAESCLRAGSRVVPDFSDDESLVECAQKYVNEVDVLRSCHNIKAEWIETLVAHDKYPDFGGSPDYACLYVLNGLLYLHIVDLKAGIGIAVDVVDNTQLLSYCAVIDSVLPFTIDRFRMTVVQPRSYLDDEVKHWEVGPEEIAAHMAACETAFQQDHFKAGPHCRWCPVAPTCEVLQNHMLDVVEQETTAFEYEADEATIEGWLQLLDLGTTIRAVLDQIEDRLIDVAKKGVELAGHKVIETKSHRYWSADEADIIKALRKVGIPKWELYVPPKMISPSQVEKLESSLSKKEFTKAIKPLVAQSVSGLRVVSETAKGRPVEFGSEFPEFTKEIDNGS